MRDYNGEPRFHFSVLPIDPLPSDRGKPTPPHIELEAFLDVSGQILGYLSAALKNKDDPWKAFAVIAAGEKIVACYVNYQFLMMRPFHRQLQATLHKAWRCARRQFIKRALKAPDWEYPKYLATFKEGWLDGEDAQEDFRAVERHLDEGLSLFGDLRRSGVAG
jgi:hypothetical protein